MLDFEVWYAKTRQDEFRQQAAAYTAARRNKMHRPQWWQRWLLRLDELLAVWRLRAPALPTTHLAPAVVRVAQQKHGGSNIWQHR